MAHSIVSYTNFLAFHPAKVTVLLAEKKLPHKKVEVNTVGVQGLQPWFMKINPKGYVPAIELDGKIIVESRVICETLDNLDGAPLGGDQVDRAVVEQLVKQIDTFDGNLWAFAHMPANIKATLLGLDEYRKKFAAARAKQHPELKEAYEAKIESMGKLLAESDDKAKVEANQKILTDLLDVAEQRLSTATVPEGSDGPFLAGPAYTVADAMFAPILFRVWNLGSYKELIEPRKALAAYNKRVRARPSWDAGFKQATSNWGKVSAFVPVLLKMKVANLLRWY